MSRKSHPNQKKHKTEDSIELKHCWKCSEWKPLEKFNKNKRVWDGLDRKCKDCGKLYRQENAERLGRQRKEYRENNKDSIKQWKKDNKEKFAEYNKKYQSEYRDKNDEKLREYHRKYYQEKKSEIHAKQLQKIRENPELRVLRNLRCRINKALKYNIKSAATKELLGCSQEFLIKHLESKFQEGMNWDNYALNGWHVDHIKPCHAFNMLDPEQQRKCFHYTNLQPLWGSDNCSKGAKYVEEAPVEGRASLKLSQAK